MHPLLFSRSVTVSIIFSLFITKFNREHKEKLFRIPRTGDDIRGINDVIQQYAQSNYYLVLITYISIFINFVSCGIPGTAVLCILAGPVFGSYKGFALVHCCAVTGACMNYFLAMTLGSELMEAKFPGKLAWMKSKIDQNKNELFNYLLCMRLAPVVPNVFLNMASGCLGIPFKAYFLSSLIGQLPFTFLYIKTGSMLDQITSGGVLDRYVST